MEIFKSKDIYFEGLKIDWAKIFSSNQTFKINTLFDQQASFFFKNSKVISQYLKDAIVDQFRKITSDRPSVDTKNPNITFLTRIESSFAKDKPWKANIYLDLCGKSLSNRGYRYKNTAAPLRENLAAGIILNTDWDDKNEIFIDSMCGSGTLLIEAALIKSGVTPTYLKIKDAVERKIRPWAFMYQKWYLKDSKLKSRTEKKIKNLYSSNLKKLAELKTNQIFGMDIDGRNLQDAKKNLNSALLSTDIITLSKKDACQSIPPKPNAGIILCNPPYGERIGEEENLEKLYYNYGENLKRNFCGYRAYIFTGNPALRKKISLQTSKRIPLYNGAIECRLLRYELR